VVGGPEFFTWSSIRKLDGLLWGSFLAAGIRTAYVSHLINIYTPRVAWVAGLLFFILIFVPRRFTGDNTVCIGYYWTFMETISVLFFGGILILVLRESGRLPSLMKNKFLVAFGKYSYGLFVIHNICLPLFKWLFKPTELAMQIGSPLLTQIIFYILSITTSFILAFATWHLYEKHFLNLKLLFKYKRPVYTSKA